MKHFRSIRTTVLMFAIVLAQYSYAQQPAPQPSPVDVDKLCADSRTQDQKNTGNPMYSQSDIAEQCSAAFAAHKSANEAETSRDFRYPPAILCTVSAGLCYGGITSWVGEAMSYACAGSSVGVSALQKVREGDIAGEFTKEIGAKNYIGAGMQVVDVAGDVKDLMGLAGAKLPTSGPGCWKAAASAVMEWGEVYINQQAADDFHNAERDIRNGIAQIAGAGSMPDISNFKDVKDKDGEKLDKPEELPKLDPELLAKIEETTGMTMKDFMNPNADPQELIDKLLTKFNAPPESFDAAKKIYKKGVGDHETVIASHGRRTNDSDSLGTAGYSGGAGFEGGRGLAGAKKMGPGSSKLFKDPSRMTPEELEIDQYHDIFLRVTRRYEKKAPTELELLPWALKFNQFANAKNKANGRNPGSDKLRFTQ